MVDDGLMGNAGECWWMVVNGQEATYHISSPWFQQRIGPFWTSWILSFIHSRSLRAKAGRSHFKAMHDQVKPVSLNLIVFTKAGGSDLQDGHHEEMILQGRPSCIAGVAVTLPEVSQFWMLRCCLKGCREILKLLTVLMKMTVYLYLGMIRGGWISHATRVEQWQRLLFGYISWGLSTNLIDGESLHITMANLSDHSWHSDIL